MIFKESLGSSRTDLEKSLRHLYFGEAENPEISGCQQTLFSSSREHTLLPFAPFQYKDMGVHEVGRGRSPTPPWQILAPPAKLSPKFFVPGKRQDVAEQGSVSQVNLAGGATFSSLGSSTVRLVTLVPGAS